MNDQELRGALDQLEARCSEAQIRNWSERFSRHGMVVLDGLIPSEVVQDVKQEAIQLLDAFGARLDILVKTTSNSPRKLISLTHSDLVERSEVIKAVYEHPSLKRVLEAIAKSEMINYISDDEGLWVSKQMYAGDTHGWHWGDYSFALIWVLETPPVEYGGMLQCVPHTSWDKERSRINEYLSTYPIETHALKTGDVYLLKTDTTLHRTVALTENVTRMIVNMTWGTLVDKERHAKYGEIDTWWQDASAEAVTPLVKFDNG